MAAAACEPVTAAELDATISLRLHDFDMARYELRAARLRELLLARVLGPSAAADGVSIAEYVRRQVMRVDGTLLLDRGDALFDALGARATVTVVVMRRGLPYTFEYRIQ